MDNNENYIVDSTFEGEAYRVARSRQRSTTGGLNSISLNEAQSGPNGRTWSSEHSDVSPLGLAGDLFEAILNLCIKIAQQISLSKHSRLHSELERLFLWGDGVSVLDGQLQKVLSQSSELHQAVLSTLYELGKVVKGDLLPMVGVLVQSEGLGSFHMSPLEILEDLNQSETTRKLHQHLQITAAVLDAPEPIFEFGILRNIESTEYELHEILDDIKIYIDCLMDLTFALESPGIDLKLGGYSRGMVNDPLRVAPDAREFIRTRVTALMADVEKAMHLKQEAVNITPPTHRDRPAILNKLGGLPGDIYARTGAMADLEEAINIERQAVDATPLYHGDRVTMLSNLGMLLYNRYCRTMAMADLDEAIDIERQAINAIPRDHPDRAAVFGKLGTFLCNRYSKAGTTPDLEEAKKCFTTALYLSTSPVSDRIKAGRYLLSSPGILEDQQAFSLAKTTIDLITSLTIHSLQNNHKEHFPFVALGLSSDAAAIALHFKRGPFTAIELLESGRSAIAGGLLERSEFSALKRDHPEIASAFIDLRNRLDALRMASRQLSRLLETIRSLPGFERFLLSISAAEMLEAALDGPITILNISQYRCDALIISQSGVRSLELPHLSQKAINDHLGALESLETLEWLWDDIVHPVLDALGFTMPPPGSKWPHIWWIPTGNLTRFPLHVAGYHLRRSGETALDRVVSSYASSVKAIIHCRRRRLQTQVVGEHHNILVVAMEDTPKQERLDFTGDEIKAVLAICQSMGLRSIQPHPGKNDILSALEACWIFHFAGHGGTHPTEPLHSQLFLEDWEQNPFTVASLLETNLASNPPFLAYLSAYGTGQMLDEASVEESIHLASAFQLAGFRHVIGTLWSVDGSLSVDMAQMTYEFLRNEGMRDESVSRGLHHATRTLRDRWASSETDAEHEKSGISSTQRDGNMVVPERKRLHWVPYVHYGA